METILRLAGLAAGSGFLVEYVLNEALFTYKKEIISFETEEENYQKHVNKRIAEIKEIIETHAPGTNVYYKKDYSYESVLGRIGVPISVLAPGEAVEDKSLFKFFQNSAPVYHEIAHIRNEDHRKTRLMIGTGFIITSILWRFQLVFAGCYALGRLKYGRMQEEKADKLACDMIGDTKELIGWMEYMQSISNERWINNLTVRRAMNIFSTHPLVEDRIKYLKEYNVKN